MYRIANSKGEVVATNVPKFTAQKLLKSLNTSGKIYHMYRQPISIANAITWSAIYIISAAIATIALLWLTM